MAYFGKERVLRLILTALMILLWWSSSLDASQNHAGAPTGRGIWIWKLSQAENGNVAVIINRLTSQGIQWVALKCGQGTYFWQDQCTHALVQRFHDAGIRVYGWQRVYGDDPMGEAAVANRILDLGIDGFIVDAEAEYEGKPLSAIIYMMSLRVMQPASFIAYTTFPIISHHQRFPYVEFGRYCDAVMPQAYWQAIGVSPEEVLAWMDAEWRQWEQVWRDTGHADAIKPIIPIGQGWDVSGREIARFSSRAHAAGYSAISLWVYHRLNPSMWDAYRTSFVNDSP
jgi:hypothetical protein